MNETPKQFDAETIADIRNARGCGVSWQKLADHYGTSEQVLRDLIAGTPASETERKPTR